MDNSAEPSDHELPPLAPLSDDEFDEDFASDFANDFVDNNADNFSDEEPGDDDGGDFAEEIYLDKDRHSLSSSSSDNDRGVMFEHHPIITGMYCTGSSQVILMFTGLSVVN